MLERLDNSAAAARWLAARCTGTLRSDSRLVQPGDVFVAVPGRAHDARTFVPAALAAGAAACLIEADGADGLDFGPDNQGRVAALSGLAGRVGAVASAFFGDPSRRLEVIAVTGTNGKTSTAWWAAQALAALGRRCGVVGTLGVGEPPRLVSTGLTTPDPVALQAALHGMAAGGLAACAMEASSIGLVSQRLAGTHIAVALFSNFTQDHLDYHGTMAAYWAAKRSLFEWPGLQAAVVNVDDAQGAVLAGELAARSGHAGHAQDTAGLDLWTVSARGPARLRAQAVRYEDGGLAFEVAEVTDAAGTASAATKTASSRVPVRTALVGDFNVYNLLLVLGALRSRGVPLADAAGALRTLTPVPGRMQRVAADAGGPEVVVDYAHTPDALEQALRSLRPLTAARGGSLWCVFGCGGERDAGKRPLMGAIAAQGAQRVVVTSDNPRSEDPAEIVRQILAGMPAEGGAPVEAIEDRREAIAHAVRAAATRDVVLIAGKGHEDTQEIAGVKRPFSDVDEARRALAAAMRGVHAA